MTQRLNAEERVIAAIILIVLVVIMCTNILAAYDSKQNETIASQGEQHHFVLASGDIYMGSVSNEEICDYTILFRGKANSFSELSLGKGKNQYSGSFITLTNDKLLLKSTLYRQKTIDKFETLEPNNYISVCVQVDCSSKATIIIDTNGRHLRYDEVPWDARMGCVFAEAGKGSELTDCTLTYYCNGWNKPIWMMGDSYFSVTRYDRWTTYLPNTGNNILLNGFPGRNSEQALQSLKTMLRYNTPKKIIWCMGMNDGDGEKINSNWEKAVREVIKICKRRHIELTLATIPSCPNINNDLKNSFIKRSGYRYIDFAEAVGSRESNEWDKGMLEKKEEDPCHPTVEGAIALYNEAVTTCPELLSN